jgi:hypothetical protein
LLNVVFGYGGTVGYDDNLGGCGARKDDTFSIEIY